MLENTEEVESNISNSSNDSNCCKYCQNTLVVGENIPRSDRKICNVCLSKRRQDKIEQPNTTLCNNSNNGESYNIRGISALELYKYLKNKYSIKEDLQEIIKEITNKEESYTEELTED